MVQTDSRGTDGVPGGQGLETVSNDAPRERERSVAGGVAHTDGQPPTLTNIANETGHVATGTVDGGGLVAESHACEGRSYASNRWVREGRAAEVEAFRDRVRAECTASGMTRLAARDEAWRRALAEFPPPGVEAASPPEAPDTPPEAPQADSGGLAGLGDIPADWPDLPPNATLAVEVQWVQSNRLSVRQGDTVDLSRALAPAPSHAALSWLETSLLYPAKWADITARATATQEDEREGARRERVAMGEVGALLEDMAQPTT
jgi:hypothetical protein